MWVAQEELPRTAGHVFYDRVSGLLKENGFDEFAEKECERFYAERMERPGLAPALVNKVVFGGGQIGRAHV